MHNFDIIFAFDQCTCIVKLHSFTKGIVGFMKVYLQSEPGMLCLLGVNCGGLMFYEFNVIYNFKFLNYQAFNHRLSLQ